MKCMQSFTRHRYNPWRPINIEAHQYMSFSLHLVHYELVKIQHKYMHDIYWKILNERPASLNGVYDFQDLLVKFHVMNWFFFRTVIGRVYN